MEKREWLCLGVGISGPLLGLVHVVVWISSQPAFLINVCFWLWCLGAMAGLITPWFGNRRILPWVFAVALLAPMGAIHAITAMMVFKFGSGSAWG